MSLNFFLLWKTYIDFLDVCDNYYDAVNSDSKFERYKTVNGLNLDDYVKEVSEL